MGDLSSRHCTALPEGSPALAGSEVETLLLQLDGWAVVDGLRLARTWTFPDFAAALAFVNRVGAIAEAEDHHPDIAFGWGRVSVETWTHTVGGLSENDFILAARIDDARRETRP